MTPDINKPDEGRLPNDAPVLVWYPPPGADEQDSNTWAWLPGSIVDRCGPDEWYVVVEVLALAEPDPDKPDGDAPEHLLYPACFRDSSELRPVTERQWRQARNALEATDG